MKNVSGRNSGWRAIYNSQRTNYCFKTAGGHELVYSKHVPSYTQSGMPLYSSKSPVVVNCTMFVRSVIFFM